VQYELIGEDEEPSILCSVSDQDLDPGRRRKIRFIEECRHLKKLTCKGTLRQVFICLRSRTPYPPPPLHCNRVYSILGGERWRVEPERRLEGHKAGSKKPNTVPTCLTVSPLQSINSDKHLPQCPLTCQS
jgi:hypothetical protein